MYIKDYKVNVSTRKAQVGASSLAQLDVKKHFFLGRNFESYVMQYFSEQNKFHRTEMISVRENKSLLLFDNLKSEFFSIKLIESNIKCVHN